MKYQMVTYSKGIAPITEESYASEDLAKQRVSEVYTAIVTRGTSPFQHTLSKSGKTLTTQVGNTITLKYTYRKVK